MNSREIRSANIYRPLSASHHSNLCDSQVPSRVSSFYEHHLHFTGEKTEALGSLNASFKVPVLISRGGRIQTLAIWLHHPLLSTIPLGCLPNEEVGRQEGKWCRRNRHLLWIQCLKHGLRLNFYLGKVPFQQPHIQSSASRRETGVLRERADMQGHQKQGHWNPMT